MDLISGFARSFGLYISHELAETFLAGDVQPTASMVRVILNDFHFVGRIGRAERSTPRDGAREGYPSRRRHTRRLFRGARAIDSRTADFSESLSDGLGDTKPSRSHYKSK